MSSKSNHLEAIYQTLSGGNAFPCRSCIVRNISDGFAAINCPVLSGYGHWGWPCHPTLAEIDQEGSKS